MVKYSENWKAFQGKLAKKPLSKKKNALTASSIVHTRISKDIELAASELDAKYPVPSSLAAFRQKNKTPLREVLERDDDVLLKVNVAPSGLPAFKEKVGNFLAMDCEFVGTGPGGSTSELARVSIINYFGIVIYDVFVKPQNFVTDFRTKYSGIMPHHLRNALPFKDAQQQVSDLLNKKTLVGHGIQNDLRVLFLSHPKSMIIDTQHLKRFKTNQNIKGKPGLKRVLESYFGIGIQHGSHDSIEDARSTMLIFRAFKDEFLAETKRVRPDRS